MVNPIRWFSQLDEEEKEAVGKVAQITATESPESVVWAALPNTLRRFVRNPVAFISSALVTIALFDIILPIVRTAISTVVYIINIPLTLALGTDYQIGVAEGARPGLADVPLLIVDMAGQPLGVIVDRIVSLIIGFRGTIISLVPAAGPLAPVVTYGATVLMFVAAYWAAITAIRVGPTIVSVIPGVPAINLEGILRTVTAPFRFFLGVIFG